LAGEEPSVSFIVFDAKPAVGDDAPRLVRMILLSFFEGAILRFSGAESLRRHVLPAIALHFCPNVYLQVFDFRQLYTPRYAFFRHLQRDQVNTCRYSLRGPMGAA
jgi:hypothetical protein